MGRTCPALYIADYQWLIKLYKQTQKGNLPYGDGILDQPSLLMEALETLEIALGK